MNSVVQHLRDRGMVPELYRLFTNDVEQTAVFMLYDLSGRLIGYQLYRPGNDQKKKRNDEELGRYFTYTPKYQTSDGTWVADGVFGLELFPRLTLDRTTRPLYVVEGVFKAAVLHRLGYDAVAVLTSHPKRLRSFLRVIKALRPVVAIGDNDQGGQKLVNFVGRGFLSPADLDEMTDEAVHELLRANT